MKTSELTDAALYWAVAKALGVLRSDKIQIYVGGPYAEGLLPNGYCPVAESAFDIPLHKINYSTNWSQGGPIIERECINAYASGACSVSPKNPDYWVAEILGTCEMVTQYGPTPLIAAMRCYVASKLGDEVEIPDELSNEVQRDPT